MSSYGFYGRPIMLFEAYKDWREDVKAGRVRPPHELDTVLEESELEDLLEADTRFDFPSFLFGPVRTSMWHGYERIQPNYRRYARIENAPDFRERRLKGLNGFSKPGYIGEHGEAKALVRTERPPATLVVDTYGGVYSMTRHLIINDESSDLLNGVPDGLGETMGEFIVETIIALIESNPTAPDGLPMWSTARGNQIADTEANIGLSEDSIATGFSRMTKQRDDTNRRIRVQPNTLLVGDPRLELVAMRIAQSTESSAVANDKASNFFEKGTRSVVGSRVQDGMIVYDPYFNDTNDWMLFADPARVPAFAVGFLNGQEQPQVFLKNPEYRSVLGGGGQDPYTFEVQTLDWLVRSDFGVAPVDPRGTFRASVT